MSRDWIVVSFDGARAVVYGKRGRREKGPAKTLGTIAIPIDSIRDQIEAAGYVLHEQLRTIPDPLPSYWIPCEQAHRGRTHEEWWASHVHGAAESEEET